MLLLREGIVFRVPQAEVLERLGVGVPTLDERRGLVGCDDHLLAAYHASGPITLEAAKMITALRRPYILNTPLVWLGMNFHWRLGRSGRHSSVRETSGGS